LPEEILLRFVQRALVPRISRIQLQSLAEILCGFSSIAFTVPAGRLCKISVLFYFVQKGKKDNTKAAYK